MGNALPLGGALHDAEFLPGQTIVAALVAYVVSPDASGNGAVVFWDWQVGKQPIEPVPLPDVPSDLSRSPDGKLVAAICNHGQIVVAEAATGRVVQTVQSSSAAGEARAFKLTARHRVDFSPDSQSLLASGVDHQVRVFDVASGELRCSLDHPAMVDDVQPSHEGKWLVTREGVWDAASGALLEKLPSHPDRVFAKRFSGDGRLVLTACRVLEFKRRERLASSR